MKHYYYEHLLLLQFFLSRSFSGRGTPTGSRNASRESSRNRRPSRDVESMPPPAAVKKELTEEQMSKETKNIIEEFFSGGGLQVSLHCSD